MPFDIQFFIYSLIHQFLKMFLREQLRSRSEEFVEQILQAHFGYLIQWINEAERKLEKGWSTSLYLMIKGTVIIVTLYAMMTMPDLQQ